MRHVGSVPSGAKGWFLWLKLLWFMVRKGTFLIPMRYFHKSLGRKTLALAFVPARDPEDGRRAILLQAFVLNSGEALRLVEDKDSPTPPEWEADDEGV